jgi:hypothetical protein
MLDTTINRGLTHTTRARARTHTHTHTHTHTQAYALTRTQSQSMNIIFAPLHVIVHTYFVYLSLIANVPESSNTSKQRKHLNLIRQVKAACFAITAENKRKTSVTQNN